MLCFPDTANRTHLLTGVRLLLLALAFSACAPTPSPTTPLKNECVILLHGMGRTHRSMEKLRRALLSEGYHVINFGYSSTRKSIRKITEEELPQALAGCRDACPKKIHFVTHSLGGIVVRQYLQEHRLPRGSRVVMLGPPNRGSELADYLKGLRLYKWLNGPAGQELGTGFRSTPNTLKPVDAEIGVIAGDCSLNPVYSEIIEGPDDGKVSVERAKLAEMKDFIVIDASHSFIMRNPEAMNQVLYFLKHGHFDHSDNSDI